MSSLTGVNIDMELTQEVKGHLDDFYNFSEAVTTYPMNSHQGRRKSTVIYS